MTLNWENSYLIGIDIEKGIVLIMKVKRLLLDGQFRLIVFISNDNFLNFITIFLFDLFNQIITFVSEKLKMYR